MPKVIASGIHITYVNAEGLHKLIVFYVRELMDATHVTVIQIDRCSRSMKLHML